ncbi:hypothetical protein AAHC03_0156 [Spirometra sp. Aus1]
MAVSGPTEVPPADLLKEETQNEHPVQEEASTVAKEHSTETKGHDGDSGEGVEDDQAGEGDKNEKGKKKFNMISWVKKLPHAKMPKRLSLKREPKGEKTAKEEAGASDPEEAVEQEGKTSEALSKVGASVTDASAAVASDVSATVAAQKSKAGELLKSAGESLTGPDEKSKEAATAEAEGSVEPPAETTPHEEKKEEATKEEVKHEE